MSLPWSEILNIYLSVLNKYLGRQVPVLMTEKSTNLSFSKRIYQVIYCRYFNRTFDNSKIAEFCNTTKFTKPQEGLVRCLENFLKSPKFDSIQWDIEAVNDKVAGEYTPMREIPSLGNKITYICYRFGMQFLLRPINECVRCLIKIKETFIK